MTAKETEKEMAERFGVSHEDYRRWAKGATVSDDVKQAIVAGHMNDMRKRESDGAH